MFRAPRPEKGASESGREDSRGGDLDAAVLADLKEGHAPGRVAAALFG